MAAAAGYLRSRFERAGELDLGGVIVVVPGGRAGRRLLEILVAVAEEQRLVESLRQWWGILSGAREAGVKESPFVRTRLAEEEG